jgi:hypothetical protein
MVVAAVAADVAADAAGVSCAQEELLGHRSAHSIRLRAASVPGTVVLVIACMMKCGS